MGSDEEVTKMNVQIARTEFRSVLRAGAMRVLTDAPNEWKESQEYRYEQSLLKKILKPAVWGVGCTLATFASFRLGASRRFQQFRHQYILSSAIPPLTMEASASPLDRQRFRQKELLSHVISIPKDLVISIAIGVGATAFLWDDKQARQDLKRVPGLPGRSVLADVLCPAMTDVYEKTCPEVFEKGDLELNDMQTFVRNCQKRAKIEAAVRRKKGLPDDQPVSVPFPGFLGK
jgi:hypothetical protein